MSGHPLSAHEQRHDVIVIGGSLGSVTVLRRLLAVLPVGLPAAVFIVTHMPASGLDMQLESLNAVSTLPVHRAQHGALLRSGSVTLPSPDVHMLLHEDGLRLGRGPTENRVRPSIDVLFRSAAAAFGGRTIGVLLTGLLDDGVAGLNAIKRCGGLAVVQHPDDALHPDLPRAAIDAVDVDVCTTAVELPAVLARLCNEPAGRSVPVPDELRMELAYAEGRAFGSAPLSTIATALPLTCPHCQGVLSEVHESGPLRFRCQTGHALTAESLLAAQDGTVEEALWAASRILEERRLLSGRLAAQSRMQGHPGLAARYDARQSEAARHAEAIRRVLVSSLAPEQRAGGAGLATPKPGADADTKREARDASDAGVPDDGVA